MELHVIILNLKLVTGMFNVHCLRGIIYFQCIYRCSDRCQGGGTAPYVIPTGMVYNENDLPNAPYADTTGGVVQAWRSGQLSLGFFFFFLIWIFTDLGSVVAFL